MIRFNCKLEPSPIYPLTWRVRCNREELGVFCADTLEISDITLWNGTPLTVYLTEHKTQFLSALRKAWNNDELTFTVDI